MKRRYKTSALPMMLLFAVAINFMAAGCVSLSDNKEGPPAITAETDIDDAFDLAIKYGGLTMDSAKKQFTKRKQWPTVQKLAAAKLISPSSLRNGPTLLRTVHLYQQKLREVDIDIIKALVRSERQIALQAGWQLAANYPSAKMQRWINEEISRIVISSSERENFVEQFAMALRKNNTVNGYTLLRQGLMEKGHPSFAEAMAQLNPKLATIDFMNYLALAPIEELRQLTQKTVNVYTCQVAMRHFLKNPVPGNHPQIQTLFLYSVSRNTALSDLARDALQFGVDGSSADTALVLARLPVWIQVAFVEGVRRAPYPKLNLLLSELRKISAEEDVVAEIAEVLR